MTITCTCGKTIIFAGGVYDLPAGYKHCCMMIDAPMGAEGGRK